MQLSKRKVGIAAAIITVAIWTGFIIIAREMAHKTLTPFDIAFVRMIGAAIVMVPWGWWWVRRSRQRGEPGADAMWLGLSPYPWRITAIAGTFAALLYASPLYSGFLFAPAACVGADAGHAAAVDHADRAGGDWHPVTGRRWVGLALIIGGGCWWGGSSLLRAFEGGDVWKGDVLFLASSFCWSCYTVFTRKHALGAIPATIAVCVFALLTFVPVYALFVWAGAVVSHLREAPWSEIIFQAVVQGIDRWSFRASPSCAWWRHSGRSARR